MEGELIKRLIEILNIEYDYLNELNHLVLEKKEAIIKNNIEKITELLERDREIIAEINLQEKERLEIFYRLEELYKLNKGDLTFSELKNVFPDLWERELFEIREKLLKIIEDIHKGNEKNRVLISEAVKINDFSLALLLNLSQPVNQIYDKKMILGSKVSQHILDHRS